MIFSWCDAPAVNCGHVSPRLGVCRVAWLERERKTRPWLTCGHGSQQHSRIKKKYGHTRHRKGTTGERCTQDLGVCNTAACEVEIDTVYEQGLVSGMIHTAFSSPGTQDRGVYRC